MYMYMYVVISRLKIVCCVLCRMATKLLKLAADEKREARKDGLPPSGVHVLYDCTLHLPLPIPFLSQLLLWYFAILYVQ